MNGWGLVEWQTELKRCKVRLYRNRCTENTLLQQEYKKRIKECEHAIHALRVEAFITREQGNG